MGIVLTCEVCKKPIIANPESLMEIAYKIEAVDPANPFKPSLHGPHFLHWRCIERWTSER